MSSVVKAQHLFSRNLLDLIHSDPGNTNLNALKWVSTEDFESFGFGYLRTVGTGALTLIQISAAQDNSGTNRQVIKVFAVNPDAIGDKVFGEIDIAEINKVGNDAGFEDLKFLSVEIQNAVGNDEAFVTYFQGRAHFPEEDLTADDIS